MASVFRLGASGLARNGFGARLCKVARNHNVVPAAFMRRKANRVDDLPKPEPFPYWKKTYGSIWEEIADPMFVRYDDNTRLIFVEGPPASGKTEFAQQIADEFEMVYFPTPNFDEYYINAYGFDLRAVDGLLPEKSRSADVEKFLTNPTKITASKFQMLFIYFRIEQHVNAVRHILNTGRGVVLNKSLYSTKAYVKAMRNAGYISEPVLSYYKQCIDIALEQLLRPHLVIYLDVPPESVQSNIKKRGIEYEKKSKVFTTKYLQDIQDFHKQKYLPNISDHARVLIYDWQQKPNMELIYEDIENLDLDSSQTDGMFRDWLFVNASHAINVRRQYEELLGDILCSLPEDKNTPEDLIISGAECEVADPVLDTCPGEEYSAGANPRFDKDLWKGARVFNTGLRRTPRDNFDPEFQEYVRKNFEKIGRQI